MTQHQHHDEPWRVRIDDVNGQWHGAGVLLDDRYVLTCAHVVKYAGGTSGTSEAPQPAARVRVRSVACVPGWTLDAQVVDGTWVYKGTQRGDVALLELAEEPGCGQRTTLWRAPISGGRVRAYGFPANVPNGLSADAELAGSGGAEGEWGQLKKLDPDGPWIVPGYSGAGVMALDGDFEDKVIGIVVAEYRDENARAAWILPTETILYYVDRIREFCDGEPGIALLGAPDNGNGTGDALLEDPLQRALTKELAGMLSGGSWSGAVVLVTGRATGPGSSWLVRLARTSDAAAPPADDRGVRSRTTGDTSLGFGAVDAAYDARGRSTDEVIKYLVRRFGIAHHTDSAQELVHVLTHRRPPACVIVDGVDQATDPQRLISDVLAPLARRARARGMRLVLGFEEPPPRDLPHDTSLDPTPLSGDGSEERVTPEEALEAVDRLARVEERAVRAKQTPANRFLEPPRLPVAQAPRLAVRLAVAGTADPGGELAAVARHARAAQEALAHYTDELRTMQSERTELGVTLDLYRGRAARLIGEEHREEGDLELVELYAAAARALHGVPVDLAAARRRVPRYVAAIDRRIEGDAGQ
ncbi:serine protease [Streptomyces sp. NBC_01016]|uniref:trypsin-like serine peptidase n=1 Tax=Streptomyces sp. NBC_01016 TaxID=2903720 RepID=UPI0022555821|nr:serine protease [Streptomyces sp. NBC_01016]MCX4835495.1 serine protease [Streptomyces sp. NBC_01016]